jgi:hypothetical protein
MRNPLSKRGIGWVVVCFSLAFTPVTHAQVAQAPAEEVQQLLAPIALYPDTLVAQILAAATNPAEVVDAWNWLQQHRDQQGQQLAQAVNSQSWDPSVKALTQFPSVLQNMAANLTWTSALGDAYVNGPQALLDAIQWLRRQAEQAGSLQSNSQQTVSTQGDTIAIEPADPNVVYVPTYDPWLVYGSPLDVYPGWAGVPGLFFDGPGVSFGAGIGLGLFAGVTWGALEWGIDWRSRRPFFHHEPFVARGRTFFDHRDRGEARAGRDFGHGQDMGRGIERGVGRPAFHDVAHAQAAPNRALAQRGQAVPRAGAFSGFDHGGVARSYANRGRASFGGGFPAGQAPAAGFQRGGMAGGGFQRGGMAGGGFQRGGMAGGGFQGAGHAAGGFHGGGMGGGHAGGGMGGGHAGGGGGGGGGHR